jgi:NhaP-type Na+/H+ or K+/H+ antiporter
MTFTLGFIMFGLLLVGMALVGSVLRRLPLSATMLYVAAGLALGPLGIGLIQLDPIDDGALLERITEIAVIISLFTAGLKLRLSVRDRMWWLTLRLAFVAMTITVALVAVVGVVGLGLPVGLAILLGAILAPTDPVLASDVQVRSPVDRDRLRFSLTSEAGMNDGTAFPFVMLGLGVIGLHELGGFGMRWLAIDVVWAVGAGIGVGALLGSLVGQVVLYLRRVHREAIGLDDFLALGLIALSYGVALLIHAYGFLAVFAAGLAVRRIEARSSGDEHPAEVQIPVSLDDDAHEDASHPEKAPAYMTAAVLHFNEQIERIGTTMIVVLVGAMFSTRYLHADAIWFVPLLLLIIRPVSVALALFRSEVSPSERRLIGWFGVRGVGSVYYLAYAIEHGLPFLYAEQLTAMTLSVIAVSVVVHGTSVTPLMTWYENRRSHRQTRHPAYDGHEGNVARR